MLKLALVLLAAVLAAGTSLQGHAQAWPSKPVRIVVPYTAGGPADVLVRGLGQKLSEKWGQQIVVENRPGANEIIAAEAVAKSAPDGYTFLLASDAVFTLNSSLYSKLPYDPVKDFTPVSRLVTANLMLVTRPDFPANSVKEFIAYARANPGKLSYGSTGQGTSPHLLMEEVADKAGVRLLHVPFKGNAPSTQALMGGHVMAQSDATGWGATSTRAPSGCWSPLASSARAGARRPRRSWASTWSRIRPTASWARRGWSRGS